MNDSSNNEKIRYATSGQAGFRGCLVAFDPELRDAVQGLANANGIGLALWQRAKEGATAMEICEWFKEFEEKFTQAADVVYKRLPLGVFYDRADQVPESECFFFEFFPEAGKNQFELFGAFYKEVFFVNPLVGDLFSQDVDALMRAESVKWVDAKEEGVLMEADWVVKHSPRPDVAAAVEKMRQRGLAIQTAG